MGVVEFIGWVVVSYVAFWMFVLTLEFVAYCLSVWWRPFLRIGRLAIYFRATTSVGYCTGFTAGDNATFDRVFWLFFWRRKE